MATKKRRKTKHRGNAAGMVEARGRTGPGSRPAPGAKGAARVNRFDRPPSWRSATIRAGIAAVLFVVLVSVIESVQQALTMGAFVFLLYIPLGYYTDLVLFRRRQAKRARG